MKDATFAADRIVGEAFAPFFSEGLPSGLGREILLTIRRRLRAAGRYLDDEHADEVFQRVVVEAYVYLVRHGGHEVRHVRGWLHSVSLRATRFYLSEQSRFDPLTSFSLNAAVDVEVQPSDDAKNLERIGEAIRSLRPRYQELMRLELVAGLSPTQIQERMSISSNAYFRKLKCEAYKALREEIARRFGIGFIEKADRSKPTRSHEHPAPSGPREDYGSLLHAPHGHGHEWHGH